MMLIRNCILSTEITWLSPFGWNFSRFFFSYNVTTSPYLKSSPYLKLFREKKTFGTAILRFVFPHRKLGIGFEVSFFFLFSDGIEIFVDIESELSFRIDILEEIELERSLKFWIFKLLMWHNTQYHSMTSMSGIVIAMWWWLRSCWGGVWSIGLMCLCISSSWIAHLTHLLGLVI